MSVKSLCNKLMRDLENADMCAVSKETIQTTAENRKMAELDFFPNSVTA
jgi:hypothetical protein